MNNFRANFPLYSHSITGNQNTVRIFSLRRQKLSQSIGRVNCRKNVGQNQRVGKSAKPRPQYHLTPTSYQHLGQASPFAESPEMGSLTLTSLWENPSNVGNPARHPQRCSSSASIQQVEFMCQAVVKSTVPLWSRQNVIFQVWVSTAMWLVFNYNQAIPQYHIRSIYWV